MYFQIQSTNVNVNLNASVTKIVLNFVAKSPFTCVVSGNRGLNTISAKRRRRLCRTLSAHIRATTSQTSREPYIATICSSHHYVPRGKYVFPLMLSTRNIQEMI